MVRRRCPDQLRWKGCAILHGPADAKLTQNLAAACNGVYLVIRLGQSHIERTKETAAAFTSAGAKVLGCLATNVV